MRAAAAALQLERRRHHCRRVGKGEEGRPHGCRQGRSVGGLAARTDWLSHLAVAVTVVPSREGDDAIYR